MAITSLFGPSPAELILAQQKEAQQEQLLRNQMIAQQGAEFGPFRGLYQAGLRFGDIGAQTAMQGLFPQQVDPRLQEATAVQSVLSKYADQDQTDPNVLAKIGKDLMPVAPNAGLKALTLAQNLQKESPFAKIDPSKFTTESLKVFARTKDPTDLVSAEKKVSTYRTLSPKEAQQLNLTPNATFQVETETGKISQVGQSPAVVFNQPLVGAESEYAKLVGKASGERDVNQFAAAEAASENLSKLNDTLTQLREGQANTGAFADIQTSIQKVQAKFAADKKAGKKVTDTEYLDALLGSDVFPMISSLGIGARGLDTPAERDFLRQVMTGTIKLERDTLIKLTETRKNIAEKAIRKYNERVEKGELNNFFKLRGQQPQKFEIPTAPVAPSGPPPGIDPRVWNFMTPEQKALWK